MMERLIELGRTFPENKLKKIARSLVFRCYNPLDVVGKVITKAQSLENGDLLVELSGGAMFYAQADGVPDRAALFLQKYRKHHVLAKTQGAEYFGVFWRELKEQYIDDSYQRYYKIKKGDTIIDLGAHVGTFAVRAAKIVGDKGMVVAIEPGIDNLRILRQNIAANRLRNVIVVPKGVWSKRDKLKLFTGQYSSRHSFLWEKNTFTEVEVDTLDSILRELGIKEIAFIKMDIEGAELYAYDGMRGALGNNGLRLAIAAYHEVEGEKTWKTIEPWLKRDGFQVSIKKGMIYGKRK